MVVFTCSIYVEKDTSSVSSGSIMPNSNNNFSAKERFVSNPSPEYYNVKKYLLLNFNFESVTGIVIKGDLFVLSE